MKFGKIKMEADTAALRGETQFVCSIACVKCQSNIRSVKTEKCLVCERARNKNARAKPKCKKAHNSKMLKQSKSRKEKRNEIYKISDKLMQVANQAFMIARSGA